MHDWQAAWARISANAHARLQEQARALAERLRGVRRHRRAIVRGFEVNATAWEAVQIELKLKSGVRVLQCAVPSGAAAHFRYEFTPPMLVDSLDELQVHVSVPQATVQYLFSMEEL